MMFIVGYPSSLSQLIISSSNVNNIQDFQNVSRQTIDIFKGLCRPVDPFTLVLHQREILVKRKILFLTFTYYVQMLL